MFYGRAIVPKVITYYICGRIMPHKPNIHNHNKKSNLAPPIMKINKSHEVSLKYYCNLKNVADTSREEEREEGRRRT